VSAGRFLVKKSPPAIPTGISKLLFLLFWFSFCLRNAFQTPIHVALAHPTIQNPCILEVEEQWLNHTGQTHIDKVPWPAQKGLTADHFPVARKQHLPFAGLGQFHKPWRGHCVLCSPRHWPLGIPQGHEVRMQSFCPSQLQGPRARDCLQSQLGNLWPNGEEGPYRCSQHSRVTSLQLGVPRFTATDHTLVGHDPVYCCVWHQRSCGRRKPPPGQSHSLPSSLLSLIALCPTHPPVLEIPFRHLSISPHPHNCRLGTGMPFSGDVCRELVHALDGGRVLLSSPGKRLRQPHRQQHI